MDQRTPEWFEFRKSKIGASDAAPILGMSPYRSAYDVWTEKTSPYVKQSSSNPYMQRGIDLEPEALKAFEQATGYLMCPKVLVSSKNDFLMASLDGMEIDQKIAVEIKCPGKKDHEIALSGQVPEKYIPQLQHQLYVTDLPSMFYFSYSPNSHKIIEVKRDDEFIADMIQKESEFYYENMLKGIPPQKLEQFTDMERNDKWAKACEEYRHCESLIKELSQKKDSLKDVFFILSQGKNAKGNGIYLQKVEKKGMIDYQKIPELENINLEPYRKPNSEYWKISCKEDYGCISSI